jgi:hypothetical protein
MLKYANIALIISAVLLGAGNNRVCAQTSFSSGLYQIVSGSYRKCCGIAGSIVTALPADDQGFINLSIEPQTQLATMTFLAKDMKTVYSIVPCPVSDPIDFSFGFGFLSSDQIGFHVDPGPPPNSEYWNFVVSNSGRGLRVDGTLGLAGQMCSDVPTQFTFSNVVAVLLPSAQIRVSEVEICWDSASNITYQVQYRPAFTTNDWTNLGPAILGTGTTNCINDKVPHGQTQGLYRVVPTP